MIKERWQWLLRASVTFLIAMMLSFLTGGCTTGRTGFVKEDVEGNLLYTIKLDDSQTVRFWEFEPGDVAIQVTANMDEIRNPFVLADPEIAESSLRDIQQKLEPHHDIPVVLQQAEQRMASRMKDLINKPTILDDAEPIDIQATGSSIGIGPNATRSSCPNDGYFHNWACDAKWFLQNYCNEGENRWCPTNVNGWAYSGEKKDTSYFDAVGFAQGFNSTARFKAMYKKCSGWGPWYGCEWKTACNVILAPRHIVGWGWKTKGTRWAGIDQSTDRVGLAVKWNYANGGGGSTSHAGPCNDVGEFCCPSSGGGASSYCNNNLHCKSGVCGTCNKYGDSCCYPNYGGASNGYCEGGLSCGGGTCM